MTVKENLSKYNTESGRAINILSKKLNIDISNIDFQIALSNILELDENESISVIDYEFTAEQMLEMIESLEYIFIEVLVTIEFKESILPKNVSRILEEGEIKHKGEIWVIYKYDKDPFPSSPHAHNRATGYKLHLGNGELYTNKNKPLHYKISKKDLLVIRDKVNNITLPTLLV